MPISYTIDPARRLVVTRIAGVMSEEDVRALREQLRADPAFDATYANLVDLSEATDIQLSADTLGQLAVRSAFDRVTRRAIVATSPLQFGMARMFATINERHGHVVRVFRDSGEAEAWLAANSVSPD